MSSVTQKLTKKGLISPPSFVPTNVMYETIMGSEAYGVSTDSSDMDVYGFCVPTKEIVFPHLAGELAQFDWKPDKKRFGQFLADHVDVEDERGGKGRQYDLTIFNIVKFFKLVTENNPNVVDSLYTRQECVLHITQVGNMVRENRHIFIHKGCWNTFKGYAFSQLHKMRTKEPEGKRKEIREEYGYDVKFAYHVVRLLDEVEQLLMHGDMDLMQAREHMKAVRRGEVPEEEIREWFSVKEKELEKLYHQSSLPDRPDKKRIKKLLLQCLEHHYGSLDKCIVNPDAAVTALREIQEVLEKNRNLLG